MRICVLTGRYGLSGVPLAQMRLARALAALGHEVDFLVGMVNPDSEGPQLANVRIVELNKRRVASMLIPCILYLMKRRPAAIFSAGDHLNAIVLLAAIVSCSKAKISCSSRVTPFDTYSKGLFSKGWVLKWVMRAVMGRADALTCVSKQMVAQYNEVFKNARHVYAYNIIDDTPSRSRMMESVEEAWMQESRGPILIAAGMLEPWKGFDDLIHAIAKVPTSLGARLLILGDGSQRKRLEELVEELGLGSRVKLVGYVENPLKFFRSADIFVLSSYVEGLPNVLVEAMMCGCTPVATDCPTGPREVLQDGKYGYLVPVGDSDAMAGAIVTAIGCPMEEKWLYEAVKPFSETAVLERHFSLLGIEAPVDSSGESSV